MSKLQSGCRARENSGGKGDRKQQVATFRVDSLESAPEWKSAAKTQQCG
jgi:hypothetical protein